MGKKAKKKKGVSEPGVPLQIPKESWQELTWQVETLERMLQVKSAQAEEALRSEIELRGKVDQMECDFKEEQSTTFAVTADMARQYKALQEELIYKINSLETQLTEQREELDITNHELRELIRDKDDDIAHKDESIHALNERMDEMCTEFKTMLTETLDLMKTHVDEKFKDGDDDNESDEVLQKRLQEYSNKAYNAVSASSKHAAEALRNVSAEAS